MLKFALQSIGRSHRYVTLDSRVSALFNHYHSMVVSDDDAILTQMTASLVDNKDADPVKIDLTLPSISNLDIVNGYTKQVVVDGKHERKSYYRIKSDHDAMTRQEIKARLRSSGISSYIAGDSVMTKATDETATMLLMMGEAFHIELINFFGSEFIKAWLWSMKTKGFVPHDSTIEYSSANNGDYEWVLIGFK